MSEVSRRTALEAAAGTCAAGLLAACGDAGSAPVAAPSPRGGPAQKAIPRSGGGLRASLVQVSEVPVGGAVATSAPDGSRVLVTQPVQGEVLAFSAVCPHEGCSVAPDDDRLSCPCHGSQFSLAGQVTRGPADKGLQPFAVRVLDGQVLPA